MKIGNLTIRASRKRYIKVNITHKLGKTLRHRGMLDGMKLRMLCSYAYELDGASSYNPWAREQYHFSLHSDSALTGWHVVSKDILRHCFTGTSKHGKPLRHLIFGRF